MVGEAGPAALEARATSTTSTLEISLDLPTVGFEESAPLSAFANRHKLRNNVHWHFAALGSEGENGEVQEEGRAGGRAGGGSLWCGGSGPRCDCCEVSTAKRSRMLALAPRALPTPHPRGVVLLECSLLHHQDCVFITAGPITKLCAWGEEDSGGWWSA